MGGTWCTRPVGELPKPASLWRFKCGGGFRDRVPEVSYLNIGLYADRRVKVGFRSSLLS